MDQSHGVKRSIIDLTDDDIEHVSGERYSQFNFTIFACLLYSFTSETTKLTKSNGIISPWQPFYNLAVNKIMPGNTASLLICLSQLTHSFSR